MDRNQTKNAGKLEGVPMNLMEELLKADRKAFSALSEGAYHSSRLAAKLGREGTVAVRIREIPARRNRDIAMIAARRDGSLDPMKAFDANVQLCVEGIVDPPVRDGRLLEHFGAQTPQALVELLFQSEVNDIANAVVSLGATGRATEEGLKN